MSVKAFELVPAIERIKLMSDKARTQIQCLECCGKNLYIGTDDCFVVHYVVEERVVGEGRIAFHSDKQGHKYLALKKPVTQLKAASALNRIMVLCDNTLTLLNMFDLEPILSGAKVKGVTSFCLNDNPVHSNPFSVEICVALKKKSLQIYTVTEDRLIPVRDIPTTEPPVTMSMDGTHICVALQSQYKMINYETGADQELFPYDQDHIHPHVTRISKEEFLLSAPSALGMFALASGMSQRPPLQWSDNLVSVAYSHPYILALNDEFITIHSILDQQQKQSMPFQGGQFLGEFDGRLFVASSRDIYALVPVAIEKQIQGLLSDGRVTEALDLAKNARKTGLSKEKFLKMYRGIQQQAGFIEFSNMHFDEARELFRSGHLDVRELITLYPNMLPLNSEFTRAMPPLHQIADINQLVRGDGEKIKRYKHFLLNYLQDIRPTQLARGCQVEIDTALLKLYSETNHQDLLTLISTASSCDITDCVDWLNKYQRYHALALLYQHHGDCEKALEIWFRLCKGELQDDAFPDMEFLVEFLAKTGDHDLIWKYSDWLLEKDEVMAVKIFTERPASEQPSERMRPDLIVDYLSRFPVAIMHYLQFLIFTKKLQKEKYHTHLAVLYLDRVLQLLKDFNTPKQKLDQARSELRHLLQMSNTYRVQLLLGKVKENEMHAECAILYGKLEEHDKALRILVHKLRDYGAAENYCVVNCQGKDPEYRHRLFQILLSVYLDPNNERRDSMVGPAVSLLNNNRADFDMLKVIQLIPDNWSVGLLSQFLTSSVRKSVNGGRTTRIERMLARGENLQVKQESLSLLHGTLNMGDDRSCAVCNRAFSEPTFVRYPNGVITHVHCAKNKNVCPVTGKFFGTPRKK